MDRSLTLHSKTRLVRIYEYPCLSVNSAKKNPLLLFHGAPESHEIWLPYLEELAIDRNVYLVAFPSARSDAPTPSIIDMLLDHPYKEMVRLVNAWADEHPKFQLRDMILA